MATKSEAVMLGVLLAGSASLNIFQEIRFRTHSHGSGSSSTSDSELAPRLSLPLPPSASVPPLEVTTVDGRPLTISYSGVGRPTVIYVFTPACPWCQRNLANIKHLVGERGSQFRFIGVSLDTDGLGIHLSNSGLTVPVYVNPSSETRRTYRFGNVPQTMVVSESGVVVENWMGAYGTPVGPYVERFFSVKLPGLAP